MTAPGGEAESGTQQAWRDVAGDQGRLDGQCAGAAQGVQKGAPFGRDILPAGAQQEGRGQILLHRCGLVALAVAPAVEALA